MRNNISLGAEMMCDPASYGVPLALLQIPADAIQSVRRAVEDADCTLARYTQDCSSLSSFRSEVGAKDFSAVRESYVDVGYVCRKCHMVYPVYQACAAHQRDLCYRSKNLDEVKATVKLEQIVYECSRCTPAAQMSTVADFKSHCRLESHLKSGSD